jgi:hypothetical protein
MLGWTLVLFLQSPLFYPPVRSRRELFQANSVSMLFMQGCFSAGEVHAGNKVWGEVQSRCPSFRHHRIHEFPILASTQKQPTKPSCTHTSSLLSLQLSPKKFAFLYMLLGTIIANCP